MAMVALPGDFGNVRPLTHHALGTAASVTVATTFIGRAETAAPLLLRCSLDTEPSHLRNAAFRNFLVRIEKASDGRIKTKLFESDSLFPDLHGDRP